MIVIGLTVIVIADVIVIGLTVIVIAVGRTSTGPIGSPVDLSGDRRPPRGSTTVAITITSAITITVKPITITITRIDHERDGATWWNQLAFKPFGVLN